MNYSPVRGMRDFYPDDYEKLNYIFETWKSVSHEFGFRQYDTPIVESLELLERKSGEEVSDQIYNFQDKSGRNLALRAEMTPSLARLVITNKQLKMPLKWFSIPQCFRYERMSKGRKREHYQWNSDIIGVESSIAEAELIAVSIKALNKFGLTKKDFIIKYNSRQIMQELFLNLDLTENEMKTAFLVLDKKGKVSNDVLKSMLKEDGLDSLKIDNIINLLEIKDFNEIKNILGDSKGVLNILEFNEFLKSFGIEENVHYDISIVRGLSYYTGIVFEGFDIDRNSRALLGGGRYDTLFDILGEKSIPAVGFGFGDVVLADLIDEKQLWGKEKSQIDYYIGFSSSEYVNESLKIATSLRNKGLTVYSDTSKNKMKKILSNSNMKNSKFTIILDEREMVNSEVLIKDMNNKISSIKKISDFYQL
ncbi:MAG: histidine--tRNA ligase [Clostridiales bacterium]